MGTTQKVIDAALNALERELKETPIAPERIDVLSKAIEILSGLIHPAKQ